jgi:hypothetical protein
VDVPGLVAQTMRIPAPSQPSASPGMLTVTTRSAHSAPATASDQLGPIHIASTRLSASSSVIGPSQAATSPRSLTSGAISGASADAVSANTRS